MAILLWVRTKRHVDTLTLEVDELRLTVLQYSNHPYDWMEPFEGGDHLLFLVRTNTNIHGLKAFLAPEMKRDFIVDWSLTEVGMGLGPYDAHIGEKQDGSQYHDDRFCDPYDQDADALTKEADDIGYARLDCALPYDVNGATGLWVNLARDREERDFLISQIERALPKPVQRLWQGRTAMMFAYKANHELSKPAPFGINDELEALLDKEEVAWFLTFQIGNWSVGGAIENMNPMADWIWKQRPRRGHPRRLPSKPKVVIL